MNRGHAVDTLVLQEDGRYRHTYRLPGAPVFIDTDTWSVDTVHQQLVVTLQNFWQRWRAETEAGELRRHALAPGVWQTPPERTLIGRIQLVVDSDLEWAFVRRGRAR